MSAETLVVAGLVVLAMYLWARYHGGSDSSPAPGPASPGPRRAQRRFTGRGTVAGQAPAAVAPVLRRSQAASPRAVRGAAGRTRFAGQARVPDDAIGLACGRPVAECTRGANCLCVD